MIKYKNSSIKVFLLNNFFTDLKNGTIFFDFHRLLESSTSGSSLRFLVMTTFRLRSDLRSSSSLSSLMPLEELLPRSLRLLLRSIGMFWGGSGVLLRGREVGGETETDREASLEAIAAAALMEDANLSIRALCSAIKSSSGLRLLAAERSGCRTAACQKCGLARRGLNRDCLCKGMPGYPGADMRGNPGKP